MEKIDIVLWTIGGGFVIVLGVLKVMWNEIKDMRKEIQDIRKEIQDIDRRLCRLEGAFSSKEFCVLKNDNQHKKVD